MKLEFNFSGKTDKGLVRKQNEDNLGEKLTSNGHVYTVCDGMGGHIAGQIASETAVNSILEHFDEYEYFDFPESINQAIRFANDKIFEKVHQEPTLKGMGTTATVLLLNDEKIYIGHIGDSRIYLNTDNILHRITKDHSLVQQLVDRELLTEEEAENDPRKNKITRALGVELIVNPTVITKPILPKKGDIFLLCSDGLTDMVSEIEICRILNTNQSIENKAITLVEMAKDAGGKDNITIQLIEIKNSPHNNSIFNSFSSNKRIKNIKFKLGLK